MWARMLILHISLLTSQTSHTVEMQTEYSGTSMQKQT
jgi:hypothetical protein